MNYEEILELSMEIIANAGESKSLSMLAIKSAKKGEIELANEYLKKAKQYFNLAHKVQTNLISYETGNKIEIHLILIHAEDHLTMANLSKEYAQEIVDIYKLMKERDLL